MITAALIVSAVAMLCSGTCLVAVLALLGRKDFAYATKADLEDEFNATAEMVRVQGRNLSRIYRYVEAIDEHLGANGHRVLGTWMPEQDPQDAHR